jgi:hypothetical protein
MRINVIPILLLTAALLPAQSLDQLVKNKVVVTATESRHRAGQFRLLNSTRSVAGLQGRVRADWIVSVFSIECSGSGFIHWMRHCGGSLIGLIVRGVSRVIFPSWL